MEDCAPDWYLSLDAPGQKYGVGGIHFGTLPLLVPRDCEGKSRMGLRETLSDCLLSLSLQPVRGDVLYRS